MILPDQKLVDSIRMRLYNESRERGLNRDELIKRFTYRGFLDRLSRSPYRDRFILKGGQVIIAWGVPLVRTTRDIDFRGYVTNSVETLVQIIKEICLQPVEPPDALIFDPELVTGEVIHENAEYQGIRVLFWGKLGKSPPSDISVSYPSMLGFPEPLLRGYTPETVIAEKLQAMVFLGEINSRMNDFCDIWLLSRFCDFNGLTLQKAITVTFQNRDTPIPKTLPTA